jgi:hypothetical protein
MSTDLSHREADIEVLASIKKGVSMSGVLRSRVTQTSLEALRDLGMSDNEIDRYLRRFGSGTLDPPKAGPGVYWIPAPRRHLLPFDEGSDRKTK